MTGAEQHRYVVIRKAVFDKAGWQYMATKADVEKMGRVIIMWMVGVGIGAVGINIAAVGVMIKFL